MNPELLRNKKTGTKIIHAGAEPDPSTGAGRIRLAVAKIGENVYCQPPKSPKGDFDYVTRPKKSLQFN